MKSFLTLIVMLLTLPLLAFGQTPNKNKGEAKVEQELRKLVRAWDDADVKGDTATLDKLLADEFVFLGGPTKAQYLASLKTKSLDTMIESAVSTDVQVQVYGNIAIVTGLDTITGKNKGQPFLAKWLYMDVWIKRSGRWQCLKTYSTLSK